jgi:o-succinylbenzoate---CoA ligase
VLTITQVNCPISLFSKETPNKSAVNIDGKTISYIELDAVVTSVMTQLSTQDIGKGDVIMISSPKLYFSFICTWALFRLGCTAFSINYRFSDKEKLSYYNQTSSKAIISEQEICGIASLEVSLSKKLTEMDTVTATIHLDQIATYLLTSGSTGRSKVVVSSFGNFYFNAKNVSDFMTIDSDSNYIVNLPLYHVSGLSIIFRTLFKGGQLLFSTDNDWPFLINNCNATHASMVESQLSTLLNNQIVNLSKLDTILLGGSAISPSVIERALAQKISLLVSYGLTEASSQVYTKNLNDQTSITICEIKTINNNIAIKGKSVFMGYLVDNIISLPLNCEGFFLTNDRGNLGKDSDLSVYGRNDNCFISGGENIHPEEIELIIGQIDGVKRVIVVPKKDKKFQYIPVAFIETDLFNEEEIANWITILMKQLPKFKIPKEFYSWPKNSESNLVKLNRKDFENQVHS